MMTNQIVNGPRNWTEDERKQIKELAEASSEPAVRERSRRLYQRSALTPRQWLNNQEIVLRVSRTQLARRAAFILAGLAKPN